MNVPPEPRPIIRTLVLVDEAGTAPELHEAIAERSTPGQEVLVVGPHLDRSRVARCVSGLARHGVFAWGRTGPSDPLAAVGDALHQFAAEEIVVVADAEHESHRLGVSTAWRLSREFGLPVVHLRVGIDRSGGGVSAPRELAPAAA